MEDIASKDRQFVELVKNDPEAITLLKKLASPHISLTVEDLPYKDSGTSNSNLHRLFELNKEGWVTIQNKNNSEDCLLKTFNVSDKGRELLKLV